MEILQKISLSTGSLSNISELCVLYMFDTCLFYMFDIHMYTHICNIYIYMFLYM